MLVLYTIIYFRKCHGSTTTDTASELERRIVALRTLENTTKNSRLAWSDTEDESDSIHDTGSYIRSMSVYRYVICAL